ncbi:hypothetical protein [Romboutsia sp. MSSM.1001216sp_RTP31141st1_G3_RTP31141_220114]|uniref:hypothetical protein n=1 Tax=unclassified Romboutsia TaxID=2626894 RepID=UPI0031B625BF
MEKYSVNVTLDTDNDRELIDFFKNYKGKKVDAIRCLGEVYFKSKKSLNNEQKEEVKGIIRDMLSTISLNINANEININGEYINKKTTDKEHNILKEYDDELEKMVDNCGIDIDF